jgi:ring-1,2-phenylacetyl-CoA epoxidase subunit PaaE
MPANPPTEFLALSVAEVHRDTPDSVTIGFDIPNALRATFAFQPGQFLNVRAHLDGQDVQRSYSICSGPSDAHLRIAIKRVTGGWFSVWANATLVVGSRLDVMPPQGRFTLAATDGSPRHILGLAAGAGITPIIAMAAHALAREPATLFTLVYGNRTLDDIMFRAALEDMKDAHVERFTLVHVLSRERSEDGALFEGRITPDILSRLSDKLVPFRDVAHAYLCGPGSMIKKLRPALFALGLARDRVHHEFFAAGGGAYRPGAKAPPIAPPASTTSAQTAGQTIAIEAIVDGTRHRFTAHRDESVADAALRAGVRVPWSCRAGMCCTCRAKIVEGSAVMRHNYSLEDWEMAQNYTLTCQAVPTSDRIVVDYDQM